MTPSNPISASDYAHINRPVDANGYLNATEDNGFAISGTSKAGAVVWLHYTDGTTSVDQWITANGSGVWSATTSNLSGLAEGTVTIQAKVVGSVGSSTPTVGSSGDSVSLTHDTIAPTIGITPLATSGRPTISGTSTDVPAGNTITVVVDADGDTTTTGDLMTYAAVVGSGGAWSVNTNAVAPTRARCLRAGSRRSAHHRDRQRRGGREQPRERDARARQAGGERATTNSTTPTVTGTWGGSTAAPTRSR